VLLAFKGLRAPVLMKAAWLHSSCGKTCFLLVNAALPERRRQRVLLACKGLRIPVLTNISCNVLWLFPPSRLGGGCAAAAGLLADKGLRLELI